MKDKTDISQLFWEAKCDNTYVKVCAPMVRYSKLQFRRLVRKYGVDLCFTPMIMADSFCQSNHARSNEFTTSTNDSPLVVQYAAKSVDDFIGASKFVYPFADGIDLNCGCPQRWAIKDGYGCAMLSKPEVVHQIVREFKNNFPSTFSISVKLRLLKDLKETINMCRQIEKCGVSFITVHGRTAKQKSSEDVDIDTLSHVARSLQVPFISNGGVKNLQDADDLHNVTKCDGVMAASGILTNPALFSGAEKTPASCVSDWLNICVNDRKRMIYQCFHHHLVFMLEKTLTKKQKQTFNYFTKYEEVEQYLEDMGITRSDGSSLIDLETVCEYPDHLVEQYSKKKCNICNKRVCQCIEISTVYDSSKTDGKYFNSIM